MGRNDRKSGPDRRSGNDRKFGNDRSSGRDSGSSDFNSRFGGYNKDRFHSAPKEMHKAVCAECKKECDVPFKPTEGRPVYCKECYAKHRPQRF